MKKITSKNKPSSYFTGYLRSVFDVQEYFHVINKLVVKIKKFQQNKPFDAIAFTGTSGAAVAFTLAYKLKVPLICIRKTTDKSHYKNIYEGIENIKRYIIVDDFIETGSTIDRIKKGVCSRSEGAKLVGIFLYRDCWHNLKYKDTTVYGIR
jgi:adenine/guanine phosphoribosyltransferase-like PRPP-binding protein